MSSSDSVSRKGVNVEDKPFGLREKCMKLANNLWWSWHPEVIDLFRSLDPSQWRMFEINNEQEFSKKRFLSHNPIALLSRIPAQELEDRVTDLVLNTRIDQAYRRLQDYMKNMPAWAQRHVGVLGSKKVAYFSLEFGVHESVPIYSGGLGVLAGDHIKSASDLGVPLVAIGLFYDQGYFTQELDINGWQEQKYHKTRVEYLPLKAIRGNGQNGSATIEENEKDILMVSIKTRNNTIYAKVRRMQVGRVELYLLDTDLEGNSEEDRNLTSRLYGGDNRTRIRQEIVSGIGGIRALRALGIHPGVFHLNEGHNAFAALEAVRQRMQDDGMSFDDACTEVAQHTVFTTHTPVPAGHDRFSSDLIEEHLGPLRDELGISHDQLMSLGRVNPDNKDEPFCMTVLGLKLSRYANAVSSLHGYVSRKMWHCLWPTRTEDEVPIGHITNGVHVPSWMAWQMKTLFERHLQFSWSDEQMDEDAWAGVKTIDPGEIWETHNALKNLLVNFVRRRLNRQCQRRGESKAVLDKTWNALDPQILTLGFGRRFATYKRATLLLSDVDRLDRLCNNPDRPVQFVFAGKAHPADNPGKEFIQTIANLRNNPRLANRFVFIEDYDINVCRHMVQGVDVWLNNPRRPLEASGTSGMKAVLNGALNLSILDGWWAEAYDGTNGFAIGHGTQHVDDTITDKRDAEALFETLENEVIPCYYQVDEHGLPVNWVKRMQNSISTLAWRFSAHRMVADYVTEAYLPAAGGCSCQMKH